MHLQILLNTGDTTQVAVRRSGYTIKKMIEAQERQMAGH